MGGFTEAVVFGLSPERLRSSQASRIRKGILCKGTEA